MIEEQRVDWKYEYLIMSHQRDTLLEACKALFNSCMSALPEFKQPYEKARFEAAMNQCSRAIAKAEGTEEPHD